MPRLVLKAGKDTKVRRGYPWVFANQLARVEGEPGRGAVVQVATADGTALGQALYHDASQIAGRFLTRDPEAAIDDNFFRARLRRALDFRKATFPDATHARLVFSESDGLPGTIIDHYGPPGYQGGVLTFTTLSYGMEQRRDVLLDDLEETLRPAAIVERNDVGLRGKDALPERAGLLRGELEGPLEIEEGGVRFLVDVLGGPKTGFFIDQRMNRGLVASLAHGRRVLDVFSADGGFGLRALAAGATSCHFLDVSAAALARVQTNAQANGLAERVTTEAGDALDRLGELAEEPPGQYDLIVLDPPGFAKSRRDLDAATRAYQRINISALRMLAPGGILATASCSQAIEEAEFLKIVHYAARRADVTLRRLARGTQPPDHPVLETMPETEYLTFFVFEVMERV
ncbi:MAG TPA: class I SAM-dependent rRNA methyltransferase [Rubricoccaceae bacterium]|nr:class I SAM-dependent rRNA methyltransferase [Rubricoccaceae bacterium]